MALGALLDRLAGALFGGGDPGEAAEAALVAELVELVVDAVEPRVRLHSRYRHRLDPCLRRSLADLREIATRLPEPVVLSRAAWSTDPCLNALFATASDLQACLGDSRELRGFFADPANATAQEAVALLVARREERTVFTPRLEGKVLRTDVAQATVGFARHRLLAPAATALAARREVGRRLILRLAQVALKRIVDQDLKAAELREHKAYLAASLRMLQLAHDGMQRLVEDPATIEGRIAAVQAEIGRTLEAYAEARGSLATLDGYIGHIEAVFGHPGDHVQLRTTDLRLSLMGVKLEPGDAGPANVFRLHELSDGRDLSVAIAFVRCPRSELPPEVDRIAEAERLLRA
jgi:hypothetical protein